MHPRWLLSLLLSSCAVPPLDAKPDGPKATSCLPAIELAAEWTACRADGDCRLAGDGCRSCGNFLAVNAQHQAAATRLDLDRRREVGCAITCEACSPKLVKLSCEAGRCSAKRVAPGG